MPKPIAILSRRRKHTRGQALVELALVVPILLLLFAAAADLGRAFYAYVAIENSAKEGAFYGARAPLCDDASGAGCGNPNNVLWRVRNELGGLRNPDGTELTPSVQCIDPSGVPRGNLRDCAAGDTYAVGLSYQFRLVTPILGSLVGDFINLRSTATAVVLNLAFDPSPGSGPQKLVSPVGAVNESDITTKCLEPDDSDAAGFYRSPCQDSSTATLGDVLYVQFETGDPIAYKVTVRNTGAVSLSGLTISDSLGWPASCPARPTSLAVGGQYICEYQRTAPTVPGVDPEFDYVNQLTVDANEINPTTDVATVVVKRPPGEFRVLKWVSPYKLGQDGDGIRPDGVLSFGTLDTLSIGYNATIPAPSVWYKVIVTNIGGLAAPGVQVIDSFGSLPYGQNNATAACDAAPTSLAPGASFECRYRRDFGAASPNPTTNTVRATSTDSSVIQTDDATATVNVAACGGPNQVVPNLVGLTKTNAETAWQAAGFALSNLLRWSGNAGAAVVTQSQQAFSCVSAGSTMTITRTTTP